MGRTVFRNANLLNGRNPSRPNTNLVVEGERIESVGKDVKPRAGDRVLDLAGRSLLPGLFSCHFHASFDGAQLAAFPLGMDQPPGYLMLRAAKNVRGALEGGFTSLVGAGGGDDIDAQLAQAIEDDLVRGPRLTPGSHDLGTTGGYVDLAGWWWRMGNTGTCRLADGVDEWRQTVREEIHRGARMIKIYASGGHGSEHTGRSQFSPEELCAVVETAHQRGARVRAHVCWKPQILECIAAGVDVIDHGDEIDAEIIDAMLEKRTVWVPSALYLEKLLNFPELQNPEFAELRTAAQRELDNILRRVVEAQAAGVCIVPGDDYGVAFLPHGNYAEELEFYVKRAGVSPLEVLGWATANGAAMVGVEDELGDLAPGKLADLIVVDGDPSADISILSDPKRLLAVVKGGRFERDLPAN